MTIMMKMMAQHLLISMTMKFMILMTSLCLISAAVSPQVAQMTTTALLDSESATIRRPATGVNEAKSMLPKSLFDNGKSVKESTTIVYKLNYQFFFVSK